MKRYLFLGIFCQPHPEPAQVLWFGDHRPHRRTTGEPRRDCCCSEELQ